MTSEDTGFTIFFTVAIIVLVSGVTACDIRDTDEKIALETLYTKATVEMVAGGIKPIAAKCAIRKVDDLLCERASE